IPKKQKSMHWGFVTVMAASVSLLLISVFLLYELNSKQKELDGVHAQINRGIPPIESIGGSPFNDDIAANRLDIEREELPGPIPTDKKAKHPPLFYDTNLAELKNEKGNNRMLI